MKRQFSTEGLEKIAEKVNLFWIDVFFYLSKLKQEKEELMNMVRERPFNLILVEKKKSDSEFLSYNLMLTSRVVRTNISERNKKHNTPLQDKWSVP
jgi:hypothetical protein